MMGAAGGAGRRCEERKVRSEKRERRVKKWLMAAAVLAAGWLGAGAAWGEEVLGVTTYGDVNCDGVVDLADCILLRQYLNEPSLGPDSTEEIHVTAQGMLNADVVDPVVGGDWKRAKLTGADEEAILMSILHKGKIPQSRARSAVGGGEGSGGVSITLVDRAGNGEVAVDATTGGRVEVVARLDGAEGAIAGVYYELKFAWGAVLKDIGNSSAALNGANISVNSDEWLAACISMKGRDPIQPTTGAALLTFTVEVPAGTAEGRYEVGLDTCRVYQNGTTNTYAVSVTPLTVVVKAADTRSELEPILQVEVPVDGVAFFSWPFSQKATKFAENPLAQAAAIPQGTTVLFWDDEAQLWSGGMKSAKGWPAVVSDHVLAPGEGFCMKGPNGVGFSMDVTGWMPQAGKLSRDFSGGDAWSIMAHPYPVDVRFGDTELADVLPPESKVRFWYSEAQMWLSPQMKYPRKGWTSEALGHVLGVGEAFFVQSKTAGTWEAVNPVSGAAQTAAVPDGAAAGRRRDGERAAADGGVCVLWGSGGWMMASGGEAPVAKDNEVIWQLIDAGADGRASAPSLTGENWLGGDDVLLAVREIPKGGGSASDGTTWNEQLVPTGGVAVYVDETRQTGGKVYQRVYQGKPEEGGAYFQTGLFEVGATHTWAGDPPELFYFDEAGDGVVMDRVVTVDQGSETNPIEIATRGDWEALVAFVAGGGETEGMHYKQTANIVVTNGVGALELPFRGTYDGNGKKLTVSLSGGNGVAPFAGIEGATIRNLTVAGRVEGGMHCAGLAGYASGTNLIESCLVRASVVTTNTHCGGVVGHGMSSQTTLSGCVFWGEVSGTTADTLSLATIWGWSEGATVTLESCLDASDSVYPIGLGFVDPGTNGIRNTYYLSEDKTTSDWRKWSYRGKLGIPVAAADGVQMSLSAGSVGVAFSGMVIAGAGEKVRLLLEGGTEGGDFRTTAGTLAKDGAEWALTLPDTQALIYPASGIPYVDPTDGNQVKYCTNVDSMSKATWEGGKWYVAEMPFFITGRIKVEGAANLILRDGIQVIMDEGIQVGDGASLTIWGQSAGSGRLEVTGAESCAGIGGNKRENGGAVTINGGVVVAQGGMYGAGIGGGDEGTGGVVTVNGGELKATGYEGSAGIGGGDFGNGGEFKITGGKVTATGSTRYKGNNESGQASAGIGAGRPTMSGQEPLTSGKVTILGGEVAAFAGVPDESRTMPVGAQAIGVNLADADHNEANNPGWLELKEVAVYTSADAAEPVPAAEREAACRGTNVWVRPCPHQRGEGLACAWCGTGLPPDLPGAGTAEEPYLIGDYEDLTVFALAVNSGHTNAWGRLTNDIVATRADWVSIGSSTLRYNGTFDGDGHTIYGLSNEDLAEIPSTSGLFEDIHDDGVVRNVRLEGVSLKAKNYPGGITSLNFGAVSNCCVSGKVACQQNAAGGIAGANFGILANCYNAATLEGDNLGGIAGENNGTLMNCYNIGSLTGTLWLGGIVGAFISGTVANCHSLEDLGVGIVGWGWDPDDPITVLSECSLLDEYAFQEERSFVEWDFENVWVMGQERPLLRVFGIPAKVEGLAATAKDGGIMELTYRLSGDFGVSGVPEGVTPVLKVTATDWEERRTWEAEATALSGDTGTEAGEHTVKWDWMAQGIEAVSENVTFLVEYAWEEEPRYCVVDLSAGAGATNYPVEFLAEPPDGGFNTDEFKTGKLALRRVDPTHDWNGGAFMMGKSVFDGREGTNTRLTNAYYIGVFEMTQRQWELVEGWNPAKWQQGGTWPVEYVSYETIRGTQEGAQWPKGRGVDADSFAGKLRARTGLGFDLPTEAQWEFACRAGTETDLNSGKNLTNGGEDAEMGKVGRYGSNSLGVTNRTASVGSYDPNAWGLYDMHGNVREWCLDWYGANLPGGLEPDGPDSDEDKTRVVRGGGWSSDAEHCTSAYRESAAERMEGTEPSFASIDLGLRLCIPGAYGHGMSVTACSGESERVAVWVPSSEKVGETTWLYMTDQDGGTNATVVGASPAAGDLTMPTTLGGRPVVGIGEGAFKGCGELTGLWIPDGVGSVGAGAFEGSGLVALSVPGAWRNSGVLEGAGVPEGCQVDYRGSEIRIMAIGVGSNSVSLQFNQDAATVFGTDDLKGEWKVIPRTDFTLEGTNATIPLEKAYRFLRAE